VLALVVLRRSRRAERAARDAEERHDAKVREVLDRRRRRAEEHAAQQRAHEESVASAHSARPAASAPRAGAEKICPICGHEFGGSTAFCPHDGAALVPAAKAAGLDFPVPAAMANAPPPSKRGKICPTCGDRFDGGADYCGKDGTQLVLLN